MKDYEMYKYRRIALGWSIEKLSINSGVHEQEVRYFEEGKNIGREKIEIIKKTLRDGFCNMSSKDHYKARIMELAIEINKTNDENELFQMIGHMMVECGKLQMETVRGPVRTKADWEKIRN